MCTRVRACVRACVHACVGACMCVHAAFCKANSCILVYATHGSANSCDYRYAAHGSMNSCKFRYATHKSANSCNYGYATLASSSTHVAFPLIAWTLSQSVYHFSVRRSRGAGPRLPHPAPRNGCAPSARAPLHMPRLLRCTCMCPQRVRHAGRPAGAALHALRACCLPAPRPGGRCGRVCRGGRCGTHRHAAGPSSRTSPADALYGPPAVLGACRQGRARAARHAGACTGSLPPCLLMGGAGD